jgi:CO/xanthine dehydrogenase Mo-binding subunit
VPAGQGHETTFRSLIAERLAIDPARIRVAEGDPGRCRPAPGPAACRPWWSPRARWLRPATRCSPRHAASPHGSSHAQNAAARIAADVAVDDLGREMSPPIVGGQRYAGITQGIGQALHERVIHAGASGQLLSGSFRDYALPRAADLPRFRLDRRPIPSRNNPLGIKGWARSARSARRPR